MTQQVMYPAQPDSPPFTLATAINAVVTTLTFNSLVGLLAAPNTITLNTDNSDLTPETIYYPNNPVGNTLSGVTRGFGGTTAKSFSAGAIAVRGHTSYDHNTFRNNILDLASITVSLVTGTAYNVEDNVAVTYAPGGTPKALILIPVCSAADVFMTYMQIVSLGTFTSTYFTANIKTNTGSSGNPMTITWIAVM